MLEGVAIAIPGPVDTTANRIDSGGSWSIKDHLISPSEKARVPGLAPGDLMPRLSAAGIPIIFINDAIAAAAGCVYGSTPRTHPLLCISLGTFGGVAYSDGTKLYPTEKLGWQKIEATGGPHKVANALRADEVAGLDRNRLAQRIARSQASLLAFLAANKLPLPQQTLILGGNSRRLAHAALPANTTLCPDPELVPQEGLKFLFASRPRWGSLFDDSLR